MKMSWLDSSFSFAKTAFSTAQKSIDRVLDIKEDKSEEQNGKKFEHVEWSMFEYLFCSS